MRKQENKILSDLFRKWIKEYIAGQPKDVQTVVRVSHFIFRPYFDLIPKRNFFITLDKEENGKN